MTLAQIANRIASNWLTVRTAAELPADHQQLLLDAIHTGFGEYFSGVPQRFRVKEWGARFGAALTGTAAVTSGSRTVTFTGVTPIEGATVVLAGDTVVNRVQVNPSGGYLLEIAYGGSTGTVAATVERDTAVIPWEIAGLITPPHDARSEGLELAEVPLGSKLPACPGFRIEQSGNYSVLRIIPPPESDFPVSMTVEIENLAITGIVSVTNYSAAALPVSDDHCIRLVAPLAGDALVTHPLFKDRAGMAPVAARAAERARADMRLIRPRTSSEFHPVELVTV
jgi:hypothetical protein